MDTPTMQIWSDAWHNSDIKNFKNIYSENALIFPPNKATIQGNEKILEFMKGGFGKVDVTFIPNEVIINPEIIFEQGIFQDKEWGTSTVTGFGNYSLTWTLEQNLWKIKCHTWSMPIKI
jgi:ketosteroid isomerase-like protein